MVLDDVFRNALVYDYEQYELLAKEQQRQLGETYNVRNDLIIGDTLDKSIYSQNVYATSKGGEKVWLGVLINRSLRPNDCISLVTDVRLLDLLAFHDGWFPFAVKIQDAINNGHVVQDFSGNILHYDRAIEKNIRWITGPTDKNPSVIEADTYILIDHEDGLKHPDVLRCWSIDSIPEMLTVGSNVINLRKDFMKRIEDEAPMHLFCDIVRYAQTLDLNDVVVRRWLDYFIGAKDYFRFDGKRMIVSKTLLAHKRFEVAVSYTRSLLKFSQLDVTGIEALCEGALHVIDDPIFNSYSLRSAFGDLNQHVFARQQKRDVGWSLIDVRTTNFRLVEGDIRVSADRTNLIDDVSFKEAVSSLQSKGMYKNATILSQAPYYDITRCNMLKGKVNRMILALCGYTGTHSITAMIKQFDGTKSMGDDVDPTFTNLVRDKMYTFIKDSFIKSAPIKNEEVADVVFRGGTSSASSTDNFHTVSTTVRYRTDFLDDSRVDFDKVMKTRAGDYLVNTSIKSRMKSKNAVIISHPSDFFLYDSSLFDAIINAGSRLVRGTRVKRIITPNKGPIYANSLTTVLPAVRLLSNRPNNTYVNTLEGSVGTTYTGALPHHVMAPFISACTNDPSYFSLAVDFGQFDSSQYGAIARAHAEGILKVREGYVSDTESDCHAVKDLRLTSMHEKLRVQAESYSRPLFYKSNGVIAAADGVKSGELTTQLRNTITNQAHTEAMLVRYNALENRNVELVSENIIGDDKVMVLRMSDGRPYDNNVGSKLISVATSVAEENHMQLSSKRTVCGNNAVEHIKIFVAGGYIMQDVFLDSVTSEKNTFRGMSYIERLTTIYDIYMTMLIRFAQCDDLMKMMKQDLLLMDGIKAGIYTFMPTVKMLAAIGGPEMLFTAPEIRGMGRFMQRNNTDSYDIINQLYATMKSRGGVDRFMTSVIDKVIIEGMVSPTWMEHFRRKNSYDITQHKRYTQGRVGELLPEYCEKHLARMLSATVKEPVIAIMNDNNVMMQMFGNDARYRRLKRPLEQKYLHVHWFIQPYKNTGVTSPYLGSDSGVQRVHKLIGLAGHNATLQDAVEPMNRLLRSRPRTHPSYISGSDVLGVLSEFDNSEWLDVLRALDFDDSVGSEIVTMAETTIHNYIRDRDIYTSSIFDNTSRTYDTSLDTLRSRVGLPETLLVNSDRIGYMYEGFKVVLYMARLGHSVSVDRFRSG